MISMFEDILEKARVDELNPSELQMPRAVKVPADGNGYYFLRENKKDSKNSIKIFFQIGFTSVGESACLKVLHQILSNAFHKLKAKELIGFLLSYHYSIFGLIRI